MICNFRQRFADWRRFDSDVEYASTDNPGAPFCEGHCRDAFPLLTLGLRAGARIIGLMVGGAIGNWLAFGGVVRAFKAAADA